MNGVTEPWDRRWWSPEDGWSPAPGEAGTLRVIDSWLVEDGLVRGLDLHAERFCAACTRMSGPGPDVIVAFLRAAAESLPTRGRWFPRVELLEWGADTRLRMWLRPAPPRSRTVRMWTGAGRDRRRSPGVKGIDLAYLTALRNAATAAGADEALLVSSEGHVLEGASTSIVWWRGDTLCGPPAGSGLLPGITRALLDRLIGAAGHPVAVELATTEELDGLPVWALNALHGIRPVTEGLGRFVETDATDAYRWQTGLETLCVPAASALIPALLSGRRTP